jgi:pyruvate/2-oxoglutarate dehydrogenase complex dihydrolipoamide acyltransferase (E2) component
MSKLIEVKVPDLGGAPKADVIAINVKIGDTVAVDDALVTLEGDKASMDIPSPEAGVVKEIKLAIGDKVSEGSLILILEQEGAAEKSASPSKDESVGTKNLSPVESSSSEKSANAEKITTQPATAHSSDVYAGPLVRRMAREMDIDLSTVQGSARNGRITKEDLQGYSGTSAASSSTSAPSIIKGGEEIISLNKIKRLTAENMHRNWITVPHVTQFDEADITDLEAFREKHKNKTEKEGYKLTPLAFIVKAIAQALKAFPTFNSSLDASGENLILKKYYHVGIAVDTPNGLVVPVLRDVDQKSIREIAKEMGEISIKAGFNTVLRTTLDTASTETLTKMDILLGNTIGEMLLFLAASDVSFVGGSLIPQGGHNILEPAALYVPVITGPHMFNFQKIYDEFTLAECIITVTDAATLAQAVSALFLDPALREEYASLGFKIIQQNQGALNKHLEVFRTYL